MADADASFERLAGAALDDVLTRHPDMATELGDHRFDTRLPDSRPEALEDERRALSGQLRELSALDGALSADNRVDAEILRSQLEGRLYELEVLRDHEWSPLLANPGGALYSLLARDFAPLPERLRSLAARPRWPRSRSTSAGCRSGSPRWRARVPTPGSDPSGSRASSPTPSTPPPTPTRSWPGPRRSWRGPRRRSPAPPRASAKRRRARRAWCAACWTNSPRTVPTTPRSWSSAGGRWRRPASSSPSGDWSRCTTTRS